MITFFLPGGVGFRSYYHVIVKQMLGNSSHMHQIVQASMGSARAIVFGGMGMKHCGGSYKSIWMESSYQFKQKGRTRAA